MPEPGGSRTPAVDADPTNRAEAWTSLAAELASFLAPDELLIDPAAREVYARDASHLTLGSPVAVALPRDGFALQRVVAACARHRYPLVCRGSGTGLSGGAVPCDGALVLSTARLNRLDALDPATRSVRAETGVLNDEITRHVSFAGLEFAPDPSSQSIATLGGNIAENAGGPHCLKYGVTRRHLRRLEWVDAAGRAWVTGAAAHPSRGVDLTSLLCGSEGTLGVVVGADVDLVPRTDSVTTLLAFFTRMDQATSAVVDLCGAGLLPVAVEMVDQNMLVAVEQAFGFGFSTTAAAALIVEFAGSPDEIHEDSEQARALLSASGAREIRLAADDSERAELWKCRKKAFGAVGRLAPGYVTMDVVVPLGSLPDLVAEIDRIKARHRVRIATVFHAGDGNLHPGVHYDALDPDETRRAHAAADQIIRAALDRRGSVTGEHGVGIEKLHVLPWQIDATSAQLFWSIKNLFDPDGILNPGKTLPDPDAEYAPRVATPDAVDFRWRDLTVTAPATTELAGLQTAALECGLQVPVGVGLATDREASSADVRDLVDHLWVGPAVGASGTAVDGLLEIWAETGDGRRFHAGAPVFKNVAGYDLPGLVAGAGGQLVKVDAATFQLRPAPRHVRWWRLEPGSHCPREALADLVAMMVDRREALGGAAVIYETDGEQVTGPVHVVAPGRESAWDLQDLDRRLSMFPDLGIVQTETLSYAAFAAGDATHHLPDWLAVGAWTMLVREPHGRSRVIPEAAGRFIWQSSPCVVWAAGEPLECEGWRADRFRDGGSILPVRPEITGIPGDLMRGLKDIFDSDGRWPELRPKGTVRE